jgi:hypothetical protein
MGCWNLNASRYQKVSVAIQCVSLANIKYIGLSDVVGTEEAGADARPIRMLAADACQK